MRWPAPSTSRNPVGCCSSALVGLQEPTVARWLLTGPGEARPVRRVHAAGSPFLMSSTVRNPASMARSLHRRGADQNLILDLLWQKRCGEPPRHGSNERAHQRQANGSLTRISATPRRSVRRRAHDADDRSLNPNVGCHATHSAAPAPPRSARGAASAGGRVRHRADQRHVVPDIAIARYSSVMP
jgi:hypothetical protein